MLSVLGIVLIVVGCLGLFNLLAISLPVSVVIVVAGVLLAVYGTGRLTRQ